MAGFLYYIPGTASPNKSLSIEDLAAIGLGYAAIDGGVVCLGHANGPDGGDGVVVTFNADGVPPSYTPELQAWRKGPGGKWWVGMVTAGRPGESNLRRHRMYDGRPVRLRDEHEYIIPRCIGPLKGRPATLPQVYDVGDDGETLVARVDPQYQTLADGCRLLLAAWSGPADEAPKVRDQVAVAVGALAANYRVSAIEAVGLLELLGTEEFHNVLRAAIDADEIERLAAEPAAENAA